jgi:hypothetical protein
MRLVAANDDPGLSRLSQPEIAITSPESKNYKRDRADSSESLIEWHVLLEHCHEALKNNKRPHSF